MFYFIFVLRCLSSSTILPPHFLLNTTYKGHICYFKIEYFRTISIPPTLYSVSCLILLKRSDIENAQNNKILIGHGGKGLRWYQSKVMRETNFKRLVTPGLAACPRQVTTSLVRQSGQVCGHSQIL